MKPNNNNKEDGLNLKKGPWTAAEDAVLVDYVKKHGEGNWNSVQKNSGLLRCGKSCRLRWTNHLRPNLKKGSFSPEEEKLIMELHAQLGNKWSRMAARLPGRTDNEIKNYWNTRVKRRQRDGSLAQVTHKQIGMCHLHHHYEPHSSQIPQQKNFSSFSQVNYGSLSVFDQTSLSTMTSIPTHQQVQCNGLESSLPSFQNAPPLSPQFSQNFSIQSAPASSYQFKCDYYDINPPPIRQTSFEPDGVAPPCSAFPIKLELPSSQLPLPAVNAAALGTQVDYGIIRQLARKNSGLLDDVLQEAKVMSSSNVSKVGEFCQSDGLLSNASPSGCVFMDSNATPQSGSGNQWVDSRPTDYHTNVKSEPKDQENTVDGNLSNLFDVIPSTLLIPEWVYSSSGEISNGQSSGLTDSDINLEIEQLVSSLPAVDTTTVHEQKLGTWNTMPRMF